MSEITCNEFRLKLTGTANIGQPLEYNKQYDLMITNAEVRKTMEVPNDDNTYNKIFVLQISVMSTIEILNGKEKITAHKKSSQSQKLRQVLFLLAEQLGKDTEKFYQDYMSKLINNIQSKL